MFPIPSILLMNRTRQLYSTPPRSFATDPVMAPKPHANGPDRTDREYDALMARAHKLLEDYEKQFTPKERFQHMVDRGLICPKGCVLAYGAFECDPARHVD